KASAEYRAFWEKLNRGEFDKGIYKRLGKGGREIWIQASYNPIKDVNGRVVKVVKFAIDITAEKTKAVDFEGQLSAISKNQGVIEFTPEGKVTAVNDNFLKVVGYSRDETIGQHHSLFVDAAYKASAEYRAFWEKLGRGEFDSGQYKRIAKGGREVWLQASYNPILDMNGKVAKVVKFASEVTTAVQAQQALIKAVAETQAVVAAAKRGDLMQRISLAGKSGDIADLCEGVNSLIANMADIITQIKEASDTINTAANEIAAGNNDLSQRTEEQASSLEETASSMEQLASTVKQNAENARQANQLASAASGVAAKGGSVVNEVVNTMSGISDSSRKIEDIISVIDGIAFQTNILALNAAVEAARAGEQGRGFAVVAGEVRNLAQRSAAAAKEIKGLITDSVDKTVAGTTQVENAGKTMDEIVSAVQRVADIIGEIAAASVEQSSGISQVNTAVIRIDEVTQQNAALVEQAAAAAESLMEQSAELFSAVSVFVLDEKQSPQFGTARLLVSNG
ncbi:MAG TPA: methyl-accepting chemotaxis protein, partial [Methylophilaceae bacterium]|nr:methyl-accepting chemotaxis protein [Methylophilaceae bacterium]